MKTNAIVRIVLYSIAILLLLGILIVGFLAGSLMTNFSTGITNEHQDSEKSELEVMTVDMNGSVSANAVNSISIDWVSGSILIRPEDTDQITFSESHVSDEKEKMVWKIDGDTLKLQYCRDTVHFPSFGINVQISKDLVITVPRDWSCDKLEIDCASASLNVHDLTIKEVDFDGASGTCELYNCNVQEFDVDTASGDVIFTGTLQELDCDAASANCDIQVFNIPSRMDLDGASGDLKLQLPADCGFSCNLDSLSGTFQSEFPTTISGDHHIHGDGSCRINVSAMSGDVTICKNPSMDPIPECTDSNCTDNSHHHGNHHN